MRTCALIGVLLLLMAPTIAAIAVRFIIFVVIM